MIRRKPKDLSANDTGIEITIRQCSASDSRSFTEQSIWEVTPPHNVVDLMDSYFMPPIGAYHPQRPIYRCRNVNIEEVGRLKGPNGGYQVEANVQWETVLPEDARDRNGDPITPLTLPWLLPVEDFTTSGNPVEETLTTVWSVSGGNIVSAPFVNSAGAPMIANSTRNQMAMSFAYNMPPDFDDTYAFYYNGKVNSEHVTVCGYGFRPFTLQVVSLGTRLIRKFTEGEEPTIAYKKVSVQLLADPKTFIREYANIGTEILAGPLGNESRARLWRGTYTTGGSGGMMVVPGAVHYATRAELLELASQGYIDSTEIEAVTDPMFLAEDGTEITPIDPATGRQMPVYRRGCPFEITDLSVLGLPQYL